MIDKNSLDAYLDVRTTLSKRQQLIFDALLESPCSNKTLSRKLGLPINCITGRTKELREKGLVKKMYEDIDQGRSINVWGVCL